jgi:arabinofuranosyltransferase
MVGRVAASRLATVAAAVIPFGVVGALTFANTPDDPLITLRYAWNLLHHGQLVFNPGQRVEGFTSPLHLLLAVLLLLVPGGYALLKLKLASLAIGALALNQTARLARLAQLPRYGCLAVVFAVAGSWNFMVSSANGLETSLCTLLVTGTTAALLDARRRTSWEPAVWAGLLALSRPDALLVIALMGVASLGRLRGTRDLREIRWLIGPILTTIGLFGFRVLYYHSLLPNTYYAKQVPLNEAPVSGVGYLIGAQPLSGLGPFAAVLVLSVQLWLVLIAIRRFRAVRPVGLLAVAPVAQVLFILGSGGDWMKGGRFLTPAIPALTVLLMMGVEGLAGSWQTQLRRGSLITALAVAATSALLVCPVRADYDPIGSLGSGLGDRALVAAGGYGFSGLWVDSLPLADCLRPGQTVAYSEVGLFGWEHLDLRVLDTRGLTNSAIARGAPAQDKSLAGVFDRRWFLPTSPIGRVLERVRPPMIIAFGRPGQKLPDEIFGDRYKGRPIRIPGLLPIHLVVYVRGGTTCSVPA